MFSVSVTAIDMTCVATAKAKEKSACQYDLKYIYPVMRVPSRFFGIRDLAHLKVEIRDFGEKRKRDSAL